MWIRWFCCVGLMGFVGVIVVVGTLVALFKIPTVEYNGLVDDPHGAPRFKVDNVLAPTAFEINLGFNMGVINPNIEHAHFESLKATAYYPTAPRQPVGGGQITELTISPYSITNFTFPFQIQYNPNNETAEMLQDIVDRCGLSGFPSRDITVLYDLTPTVRLFGLFPLSVTIRRQANIPCPIDVSISRTYICNIIH
ncbi:hypothetical protein BC941DRAFT_401500 [Chlamydoabsidia padenii]|nr:hypothetical protein BC941DRAFT_401500 [Chlamydoabsidia padenii]